VSDAWPTPRRDDESWALRGADGEPVGYTDGSEVSFRLNQDQGVLSAALDGGEFHEMLVGLPPRLPLMPFVDFRGFKGQKAAFVHPDPAYS